MRRIIWSPRAAATYRLGILDHLEQSGEASLRRVRSDIERAIDGLAQRPVGRPGRVSGTYEKVVVGQLHVVVYSLQASDDGGEDNLVIMRIVDTSREWPPEGWPR